MDNNPLVREIGPPPVTFCGPPAFPNHVMICAGAIPDSCQCVEVEDPPFPRCERPLVDTCRVRFDGSPTCQCEMPPPVMCTATIIYQADSPSSVAMTSLTPGCDGAGAELAIAVLLTKFLGAP